MTDTKNAPAGVIHSPAEGAPFTGTDDAGHEHAGAFVSRDGRTITYRDAGGNLHRSHFTRGRFTIGGGK